MLWAQNFYQMLYYQNNATSTNTTVADLDTVVRLTLKEIDSTHVYSPCYKGFPLPYNSTKKCGEFGGECLKFSQKYLKFVTT